VPQLAAARPPAARARARPLPRARPAAGDRARGPRVL